MGGDSYQPVPNDDDAGLTFETGKTKKGKKVTTAVLFVDLRNSTTLNFEHDPHQLGKLYAAFVRAMIQCAEQYGGVVRNIIGDRVMVVFPAETCCTNAVNTAGSTMNTVVTRILNPMFKGAEVKAGIGIDYGTMYVEKVGVPRLGKERDVYKILCGSEEPWNVASKLTDLAGKGGAVNSNMLITKRCFDKFQEIKARVQASSPTIGLSRLEAYPSMDCLTRFMGAACIGRRWPKLS